MKFRNKDQNSLKKQSGGQEIPKQPIQAAKRRRQLHPFFFRIGPVALSICSVLLIGLMAVLYLSQLGQAVTANQQIQEYQRQQTTLQREDQDLLYAIAHEESPDYIADHAKSLGLIPADTNAVIIVVVPHLLPVKTGHSK
jgi:cell division protein FtsL